MSDVRVNDAKLLETSLACICTLSKECAPKKPDSRVRKCADTKIELSRQYIHVSKVNYFS